MIASEGAVGVLAERREAPFTCRIVNNDPESISKVAHCPASQCHAFASFQNQYRSFQIFLAEDGRFERSSLKTTIFI